ncbi:N-6 DNA methylase [Clostridioides difficile]|uniref:N-6 DNA methylase n=1 Tax=Clostridioides difficile TaxID=1496 RepID=UPI00355C3908
MAKREIKTDLWVYELLKQANLSLDAQGSDIKEIDEALKTASKKGTGNVGFPEYVGVVKDYLLVIEDKADLSRHIKFDDKDCISNEVNAITNYAVNGALFYAKHLAKNTSYKKIFAFGISGDERKHKISPIYVDETEFYRELSEVQSFISFNEHNIDEYYIREVLKEDTDTEKETAEILKDASILHEDLRNYGNLLDTEKPLIVSGIMLALRETEYKNFSISDLTGDSIKTDGQKIYDAIDANLRRANVSPAVKKDKILGQFAFIKDTVKLNEIDEKLNKTPLKHFTEFLFNKIYRSIRYSQSAEDYIGRFYGEFMSYSGGDGQTLGIILTPKHITQLFCDLVDLQPCDVVFDPCCGTAGFLIAAMHNMLKKANNEVQKEYSSKPITRN